MEDSKHLVNNDINDNRIKDIIGENIYYLHKEEEIECNCYIEFELIKNDDDNFAGDEPISKNINVQVDIFCNNLGINDYIELEKLIPEVLKEKDYNLYNDIELYEKETKLYHRAFRFNKIYIRR